MVLNVFSAVQIVVLLSLLVVLSVSQRFDWARATKNGALVLVVLAGLTNLFVFGLAHDNKESRFARLHLHDSYHYLISAKYFRELGYQQIYQCTVKAFNELREEGSGAPRIFAVRDLDNRYQSIAAESVDCTADFSPARWVSFKADLQGFLALNSNESTWQRLLLDNGNNPPPSWALLASTLVWSLPLEPMSIQLLAGLDLLLLLVLIPIFIIRSSPKEDRYGEALLFLAMLGTTWFLAPSWVLGSYMREVWLLGLVVGVVAWRRNALVWAGFWLGLSAWLRVFPVLFLIPAMLLLPTWKDRITFGFGVGVVSVFQLLSIIVFGLEIWIGFFSNLLTHGDLPGMNHLGYYQLVTQTFVVHQFRGALPDAIFFDISQLMQSSYQQFAGYHGMLKLIVLGLAGFLCVKSSSNNDKTFQASVLLFVGICLVFFLVNIAHYYYVMLAVYFWLTHMQDSPRSLALSKINGVLMLAVISIDLVPSHDLVLFSIQNAFVFLWIILVLIVHFWFASFRNEK